MVKKKEKEKKLSRLVLQAAVMSPSVDPSMSLHPTAMITQQMGQLSLGNTGAVSGILGRPTSSQSFDQVKSVLHD